MRFTAIIALVATIAADMVTAQDGAMMRFGCAQLVTQRLDPYANHSSTTELERRS